MSIYMIPADKRYILEPLTDHLTDTMILSCMQGHIGEAYADDPENPASCRFDVVDFTFLCGEPNAELAAFKPADVQLDRRNKTRNFMIMVPENDALAEVIRQVHKGHCKMVIRYAFHRTTEGFDQEKLKQSVEALRDEYELKLIDREIYEKSLNIQWNGRRWASDWCGQFKNYEDYCEHGLGVAILHRGELVAGASSYSYYDEGIEIQIDTREDHRRQGLAYVSGAALILECLKRGLYPSWDAQNLQSARLAKKLGYQFAGEYAAYEVTWGNGA